MPRTLPSSPRVAITGASSGLGRALALAAASRKARLLLSDVDEVNLEITAKQVRARGAEVETMLCDVRDAEAVEAFAARADSLYGGTDLVANNAGIGVAGNVGDVSLEDWKLQLDINLWGVIYGCHAFIPRMKQQGSGYVLNVASAAGLLAAPQMGPYNVSKAGVVSLSETLAGELAGTGVGVSVLCPTFLKTNIGRATRSTDPALKKQAEKMVANATWTADQVAEYTFARIERRQLYILPQADAKAMWRSKRANPAAFHGALGKVMPALGRLAKRFG